MSNLTFFFQSVASNSELQKIFDDDIKDLLVFMQDISRLGAWLASYADNRTDLEDLNTDPNRIFNDNVYELK